EDVAQPAEDVFEAGEDARIEAAARAGCRAHAGMPEAVVQLALFRISDDRVGLGRFLESVFRRLITRISVRVIFHREFAIGALDFRVGRVAGHSEHVVVIALAHDALATLTSAGRSRRSPIRYPLRSSPVTSPSR